MGSIFTKFQTQQAKEYVKIHEGELQERLAQSKNTKDIMARFKLLMMRVNISLTLIL